MQSAKMREIAACFGYLRRVVLVEVTRALDALDVTPPMYHLLFRLSTDGPLSQQELTLDAGLDATGVSRLVGRMVKEGLLATRVDPKDRRRRLVRLTPKGRRLEAKLAPIVDDAVRGAVTGLDDAEEDQLLALLSKAVLSTRQRQLSSAKGDKRAVDDPPDRG